MASMMYLVGVLVMAASVYQANGQCNQAGIYGPVPGRCSQYYECSNARTSPFIRNCGPGTFFNHRTFECDWPNNVDCSRGRPSPVILSNPLPILSNPVPIPAVSPRSVIPVSINNPFGSLLIGTANCQAIGTVLRRTLVNEVVRRDGLFCGINCQNSLPSFNVFCNP